MFAASGGGSFVNLDQSTVIERNTGANPFQIVRITDDAVGEIRNVDIRSNDPVEVSQELSFLFFCLTVDGFLIINVLI